MTWDRGRLQQKLSDIHSPGELRGIPPACPTWRLWIGRFARRNQDLICWLRPWAPRWALLLFPGWECAVNDFKLVSLSFEFNFIE